jgi:DNA invertase Pin-like site-specific DNA recombinase
MRVAIVARVSTRDQNADNQLMQLRAWCAAHGHTIMGEYTDVVSGGKAIEKRPRFAQMFVEAETGAFDMALFWSLDRFTREGTFQTVVHLERLNRAHVLWRSHVEPFLCTDNELVAGILIACMAALAKQERIRISERTKAGLERVRERGSASGLSIGGQQLPASQRALIASMAASGESGVSIARQLGIHRTTARKYAAAAATKWRGKRKADAAV